MSRLPKRVRTKEEQYSMFPDKGTTKPGYINPRDQEVIRNTRKAGAGRGHWIYELKCRVCGHHYGANGNYIAGLCVPRDSDPAGTPSEFPPRAETNTRGTRNGCSSHRPIFRAAPRRFRLTQTPAQRKIPKPCPLFTARAPARKPESLKTPRPESVQ